MIGEEFGKYGGAAVHTVEISNSHALRARIITFGARLTDLWVPDRDGHTEDVVLGFDTLEEYAATDHYFGATCGRYGNRIARGQFQLGGKSFQLDCNEGPNHLHGGASGFDRKVWTIEAIAPSKVTLTATSADGEMGFPGHCNMSVTYELTEQNQLLITMTALSDADTLMNMVNHSYFNLAGQGSGDLRDHVLQVNAPFYTPVDDELLATGEIRAVTGTPFDFAMPKRIGQDIAALPSVTVGNLVGGGYDHNWCLGDADSAMREVADLSDPHSGRRMRLRATEPGVQIYTGGYLNDSVLANDDRHRLESVTEAYFDDRMAVNLRHQLFAAKAVAPQMKVARGGSIVNLSSITWQVADGDCVCYVTAKAAVHGMTRALATELGPHAIRVNAILPGWVMTERQMALWLDAAGERQIAERQALPGKLYPPDIARMALWLAADDSRMCSKQAFVVDGGWI